jgi:hypothetical protein
VKPTPRLRYHCSLVVHIDASTIVLLLLIGVSALHFPPSFSSLPLLVDPMSLAACGLSGSEQAMPILIVNMGGEMLYILEQRLQAQAIVEEKSLRGENGRRQSQLARSLGVHALTNSGRSLPVPACVALHVVHRSSVLQDVISTMFSEKFISELFKPQKMYSSTSTRQIFDRLAHSSIMRLNTSSMDKVRRAHGHNRRR